MSFAAVALPSTLLTLLVVWLAGRPAPLDAASARDLFLRRWQIEDVIAVWVSRGGRAAFADLGERVLVAQPVWRDYRVKSLPKSDIRSARRTGPFVRLEIGDWEPETFMFLCREPEWPPESW